MRELFSERPFSMIDRQIDEEKNIETNEDISFPCAKCGANMNTRCKIKAHGLHRRIRHPAWTARRSTQEKHERHRITTVASFPARIDDDRTTTLYRPVGGLEHHLIRQSGNTRFPPRLEQQPIFYPVTSEEYAIKIAKEWNTKDKANGNIGFVMRFKIRTAFISMYDIQNAGGKEHQEYWIPASDMDRFNKNIVGEIETIHVFRGSDLDKRT